MKANCKSVVSLLRQLSSGASVTWGAEYIYKQQSVFDFLWTACWPIINADFENAL